MSVLIIFGISCIFLLILLIPILTMMKQNGLDPFTWEDISQEKKHELIRQMLSGLNLIELDLMALVFIFSIPSMAVIMLIIKVLNFILDIIE